MPRDIIACILFWSILFYVITCNTLHKSIRRNVIYVHTYIYILLESEGAQILTLLQLRGSPAIFEKKKRFLPQKEANEELPGNPRQQLRGSPKTGCRNLGFPRSRRSSRAFAATFSKHFRKASREKRGLRPGSFAVLRVPQKEANFAKIA